MGEVASLVLLGRGSGERFLQTVTFELGRINGSRQIGGEEERRADYEGARGAGGPSITQNEAHCGQQEIQSR